jgi:putative heme-binding domain-containing protein
MRPENRFFRKTSRIRRLGFGVFLTAAAAAGAFTPPPGPAAEPVTRLELRPGDHLCLIGNTLAERMQFDGWLETLLQARFPRHELVIRNLGYSGDELTLRLRSEGFGSPDDHLTAHKTDVVLAFFGFNESFGGPAGLDKFRGDLERFVKGTLEKKYNGKTAPRLVLFSPIANEDLHDPNLPDGSENNRNLKLYTEAMAGVARERGVLFVDLFAASLDLYPKAAKPLSLNGVHLTAEGNRLLAQAIDRALFPGEPALQLDAKALEDLRAAVLDKCFYWYQRYRVVDGYNVYGGRSWLKFVDNQTNRDVLQREMQVLDVMTQNRERRVWARAQGKDLQVDDSNTPPFLETKSNKPGPGPGGTHLFLDGEEAIGSMKVARGMKVNLFASEKEFLELEKPVQMAFDTRGRLFVATWNSYPHWKPKDEMNDKILILEDTDGDGRADRKKVFADRLHCPTGLEFWGGGLFVAQGPNLAFLKDTDGDDRADTMERMLHGVDTADTHHTMNSFVLDPGGALYFQEGVFHHSQVETLWGPQRCANAGVFRFEPRTWKFEVYVSYPFANPHGHVFDRWGQDFVTDGTGNDNYFATAFSGHLDFPAKHSGMRTFFRQRDRPCPGTEILSSRHFPPELQGNYLVANVIGFQGIFQYRLRDEDSGFAGEEIEPIVESTDRNFRPSDIEVGPDGAIYFLDWQNPIIGHMQHHLRDPSRDHTHGRIYRVTWPGRPLLQPAKIAGEPVEKLLDLLKEPEDRVRSRARIELSARPTREVIAAADRWIAALDPGDQDREHHLLEGLWVHQQHNAVDKVLLERVLASQDFRARAAATRVLCYWRDRIPDSLDLLKRLAADPYPRVRLEAVRAASFYRRPEAVEVAMVSAEHPSDYYLDYTRNETLLALEPYWKQALAEGRLPAATAAGARLFLDRLSTPELLALKRDKWVAFEILTRKGVEEVRRGEALRELAKLEGKSELTVLLDALERLDREPADRSPAAVYDLALLITKREARELAASRDRLERLALSGNLPVSRQIGYVALVLADGGAEGAWKLGLGSVGALADLVSAVPLIPDPTLRSGFYPKLEPLLDRLPPELSVSPAAPDGIAGRFVRIELPGRSRTLTIAEVEVLSGGRNVAPQGKASQKNTASGGEAARALDGNRSTKYGDRGQTHSQENTRDPWWEVDLGSEVRIESVIVYNRAEGDLGKRLDGFTLKVLDNSRVEVFSREKLPAPESRGEYKIGAPSPQGVVRRAAMEALTHVRGQEARTFVRLAGFVREGTDRDAAVRALGRIPPGLWPLPEAGPLLESLLGYLRSIPPRDRTSGAALDAIDLARALAARLTGPEAERARAELRELGVRVIRIATVPHQMLYDKDRIVVAAGKPAEIVLENTDLMPHNLIVGKAGSLEELGNAAEAMATQPGALEKHYVPQSSNVLASTRLLQPRETAKLSFTAPSAAGVYPYLCTYPGHWRRMFGAMYVVENLEAYLEKGDPYLESLNLPVADELLKFRRPRTEWKLEDLASSLDDLGHGRSFGNGKQMFQVANCVACHRLDGAGLQVGPDLTQLDPKLTAAEVLREVIQPSAKLNEKFFAYTLVLKDGRVVTGLVPERTATTVKIIENALVKAEPVEIERSKIREELKSETSIMPEGLLNQLTREEILDLLAFVLSRGDRNHRIFQEGCAPGH